jgi:hypothetical protein
LVTIFWFTFIAVISLSYTTPTQRKQILEQVTSYFPKAQNGKQSKGAAFGEEQKSESQILLELAHANVSRFFKDQYGIAYALIVRTKGRRELIALESGKFRRFLAKLFYDNNKGIARTEHINNAIQILQANIEYDDGQTIPLSLRVAWKEDAICYDLTDEKWRYIKITKDGWQTKDDDASVLFARHNQVAQVLPDRNYESDIFDKFIGLTNVKDDKDKLLLSLHHILVYP